MKPFTKVMAVLIGTLLLCSTTVTAQDFNQLLDAVEKIELNLKELVEQEAQARSQELAKLRLEMKAIKTSPSESNYQADLVKLSQAIESLRLQVEKLQAAPTQNNAPSPDLVSLTSEVALLRTELNFLKNWSRDDNGPQLASTNDQALAYAFGQSAPHADEAPAGLEISGFFDVVGAQQSSATDKMDYGLGQAEIDLVSDLSERASIEVAVAFNPDDAFFELGAAIIDIHPFAGRSTGHVNQEHGIDHTYILAGMFDVPFGIDYHVYPSVDRKLVTAPRAVDLTHGGWNDVGFQIGLDLSYGNLVAFLVNGFESSAEVIDLVQTLATGTVVMEEVDTSPAQAFGARLGVTPIDNLEFGGSFAAGINADSKSEMTLVGADIQFAFSNFELKGEYISHSLNRSVAKENNTGYYLQGLYNFGPAFVVSRYGSFQPYEAEWIGQMSIGAGYAVVEGVELRWETLVNENSDDNANMIQLVAGF